MKFPAFEYRAPWSVDEAVGILAAEPEAKVLAGGQSLLPLLALRLARPKILLDVANIDGLSSVEVGDDTVRVGAACTLATLEDSAVVRDRLPLLAKALRHVAHRPIRNRGTIGGSIAHADPAAELPAVAVALEATLALQGPSGNRRIGASDFFTGPFMTAMHDDEVLTAIEFPARNGNWEFLEIARRAGDFALAIAAVGVVLEGGTCTRSIVVLGGVAAKPVRSTAGEEVLNSSVIDGDIAAQAASAATTDLRPGADIHGSSEYRRHVAGVLVRRAVLAAGASAR